MVEISVFGALLHLIIVKLRSKHLTPALYDTLNLLNGINNSASFSYMYYNLPRWILEIVHTSFSSCNKKDSMNAGRIALFLAVLYFSQLFNIYWATL